MNPSPARPTPPPFGPATARVLWRALTAACGVALGLALASALLGCDTPDCTTQGCPAEQVCNRDNGLCVDASPSCQEVGCPDNQFCDNQTGRCLDRGTFCGPPGDDECLEGECTPCADGLVCDASTGFCVAEGQCRYIDCPRAQLCNPETRACEEVACDADAACPSGSVCLDRVCQAGCRSDAQCRTGEICAGFSLGTLGSCRTSCINDVECDWGEICVLQGSGQSSCQAEPPCREDADCRSGETCRQQTCRRALCRSDAECSSGEYCVIDTGQCLEDTCQGDQFEPNNTAATARRVLPGRYDGLTLCKGEEDWFLLRPQGNTPTRVTLVHALGVDLDLEVYDGERVVGRSGNGRTSETLLIGAGEATELRIRVFAARGRDMTYFLNIDTAPRTCEEDRLEPNDTAGTASTLNLDQRLTLTTCPGDADFVALEPHEGPVSLLISAEATTPELWSLRMALGQIAPVALTPITEGMTQIQLAHLSPGLPLLLAATATTGVQWTVESRREGPACEDIAPGNQSPETARPVALEPGAPVQSRPQLLCLASGDGLALESDWYALELPEGPVEVRVGLENLTGDEPWSALPIRVTLLTGQGLLPWRGLEVGAGGLLEMSARLSGLERPVWLRVDAPGGLPEVLSRWPGYAWQMEATPLDACVQDRSELGGNDTPETAIALDERLEAVLCPNDVDVLYVDLARFEQRPPPLKLGTLGAPLRMTIRASAQGEVLWSRTVAPEEGFITIRDAFEVPEVAEGLYLTLEPAPPLLTTGAIYTIEAFR